MPEFTDSLLPFGNHNAPKSGLSPEVHQTGLRLYRQAWDEYRAAGCPFGETDDAMLVWYSFQRGEREIPVTVGKN